MDFCHESKSPCILVPTPDLVPGQVLGRPIQLNIGIVGIVNQLPNHQRFRQPIGHSMWGSDRGRIAVCRLNVHDGSVPSVIYIALIECCCQIGVHLGVLKAVGRETANVDTGVAVQHAFGQQ